ncbi:hypothetical protein M405DRAFT_822515 [Rhizopogon salebrosus TDB-379]|nr:hypothetical protein M405DRAFT_822515 [Rhizopogon salebrosus TDB-379]
MAPHSSTTTDLHISSPSSPCVQAGGQETPKEAPRIFHCAAVDSTYLAPGPCAELRVVDAHLFTIRPGLLHHSRK